MHACNFQRTGWCADIGGKLMGRTGLQHMEVHGFFSRQGSNHALSIDAHGPNATKMKHFSVG